VNESLLHRLSLASLFILAFATFTSVSISAGAHILIIVPGFYFLFKGVKDKGIELPKSFIALILLWVFSVMSVPFNLDSISHPLKNVIKTKYFLIAILSSYAFYYLKKDFLTEKHKKILFNVAVLSVTLATVSGLIGLWTGFNPLKFKPACHATRACGLYGMYMTYGYGISMVVSLLVGLCLDQKGWHKNFSSFAHKKFLYGATIINFVGMVFSWARGGLLGFILSLPFYFFKDSKKLFIKITIACFILAGLAFALSPKVQNVFLKRGGSNVERLSHFAGAFAAFKEKPLLGVGYKNYEPQSKMIKKRNNVDLDHLGGHAHSNYLEHLASTGALGFIAFVAFVIFWLYESYQTSSVLFIFVLNFFISGFTQYTFGDGENLFLIFGLYSFFALSKKTETA
jgi:O-antigen ligase